MKKLALLCFLCIVFGFVAVYSGHCENMIVGGQLVDESGFPVINSLKIEPLADGPCSILTTWLLVFSKIQDLFGPHTIKNWIYYQRPERKQWRCCA